MQPTSACTLSNRNGCAKFCEKITISTLDRAKYPSATHSNAPHPANTSANAEPTIFPTPSPEPAGKGRRASAWRAFVPCCQGNPTSLFRYPCSPAPFMRIHPASRPPRPFAAPFVRLLLISVGQSTPTPPILVSAPASPFLPEDSPRKAAQPPPASPDRSRCLRMHSSAPTQTLLLSPSSVQPALLPPRTSHLPRSVPSNAHRFLPAG